MILLKMNLRQKFGSKQAKAYSIVEQIHNEFYSAEDALLKEAMDILNASENSPLIKKGEILSRIGFSSMKEIKMVQEVRRKEEHSKELADTIFYYRSKYPDYKFITEKAIDSICKKYGLIFGPANRYKGDMPDKNLKDITVFLDRFDTKVYEGFVQEVNFRMSGGLDSRKTIAIDSKKSNVEEFLANVEGSVVKSLRIKGDKIEGVLNLDPGLIDDHFSNERIYAYYGQAKSKQTDIYISRLIPSTLKICAPAKDMEISGMKVVNNRMEIKDPVVLQPVENGYLIVTAWGEESKDKNVINESKN